MIWTPDDDAAIRAGRLAGLSWVKVALQLHRTLWQLRDHAQQELGLPAFLPGQQPSQDPADVARRAAERAREHARTLERQNATPSVVVHRLPLPAGHPLTWGAIARGPYPFPVHIGVCQ